MIHDYDIQKSIKELSAVYEKSPFSKDIYKYIRKRHIPPQIKGHALKKLKTECEGYLVIDDVLFGIKVPEDRSIELSLRLVIQETYVPTILYQYHDSLLVGPQGVTRMYFTLRRNSMLSTYFIPTGSMCRVVMHVTQDLLRTMT